jgi:hypothetical protein
LRGISRLVLSIPQRATEGTSKEEIKLGKQSLAKSILANKSCNEEETFCGDLIDTDYVDVLMLSLGSIARVSFRLM